MRGNKKALWLREALVCWRVRFFRGAHRGGTAGGRGWLTHSADRIQGRASPGATEAELVIVAPGSLRRGKLPEETHLKLSCPFEIPKNKPNYLTFKGTFKGASTAMVNTRVIPNPPVPALYEEVAV